MTKKERDLALLCKSFEDLDSEAQRVGQVANLKRPTQRSRTADLLIANAGRGATATHGNRQYLLAEPCRRVASCGLVSIRVHGQNTENRPRVGMAAPHRSHMAGSAGA
jgi:hypothetical protein